MFLEILLIDIFIHERTLYDFISLNDSIFVTKILRKNRFYKI